MGLSQLIKLTRNGGRVFGAISNMPCANMVSGATGDLGLFPLVLGLFFPR